MNHLQEHNYCLDGVRGIARFRSVQLLQWFIVLSLSLCLGVPSARGDHRTVTVGVYENAPKVFTSEDGRPSGIFIDIIESIAKSEGWKLEYVAGTWSEGLDRLAKGEIDLMPDVAYTSDREKRFSFHKVPVLSAWSQVYARKGSQIKSILDLNGKRIAALDQTIQLETLSRLSNSFGLKIAVIPVPDYKTEFDMIAKGKVDAGVTNRFYGLLHGRTFGLEDTPIMFDPAPFFFAAKKGTQEPLLKAIDRHLRDMKQDPQSVYYQTMKRWTSEDVRFRLPAWLQILGLGVGVILLVSFGGSILLKRQVNERTRELQRINQEMEQRIVERTAELTDVNEKLRTEIADRIRIAQMLVQSEAQYRRLVESANSIIIRWEADGKITFFNRFAQDFFGYDEQEIIGKNILETIVPPEESTGRDLSSLAADIASNPEAYARNVNENIRRNGERVWVAWTNKPIVDETGKVLEILSVGNDITKLMETEKELRSAIQELALAKEHAEVADRLKSAFLATMSHELRTPLNSILGFTGIILQGIVGPLNDEQKKQLNIVRSSAQHLLSLINDVLDISKIEAGQLQVAHETYDLRRTIEKAVESARPLAEKKGIGLTYAISPDMEAITGDRRRVEQVLLNLISNAIKFTETGSVRVEGESEGESVTIRVIDTGIGIKHEDLETIFKAFRQIDSGMTRKYEGTGLGLSICKRLVELMGGQIRVTSVRGSGSTFSFSLPKERKAA